MSDHPNDEVVGDPCRLPCLFAPFRSEHVGVDAVRDVEGVESFFAEHHLAEPRHGDRSGAGRTEEGGDFRWARLMIDRAPDGEVEVLQRRRHEHPCVDQGDDEVGVVPFGVPGERDVAVFPVGGEDFDAFPVQCGTVETPEAANGDVVSEVTEFPGEHGGLLSVSGACPGCG